MIFFPNMVRSNYAFAPKPYENTMVSSCSVNLAIACSSPGVCQDSRLWLAATNVVLVNVMLVICSFVNLGKVKYLSVNT